MPEPKIQDKKWKISFEEEITKKWVREEPYKFRLSSTKQTFSIDTPPPYINTPVHIGHASTYTMMDMFARYKRMKGYNVLFPLGLDKNGLPIEVATEKKFKIKFTETSREEFIKKCKQLLDEASTESIDSFQKLGHSYNSWEIGTQIGQIYETDSDDYRELTQETFIDLWNKGLIYEDDRINNFCTGCQTTIADSEIEYKDVESSFNDIKFKVKETKEEIIIGTTRPELVCTCGMIIFNQNDERYKHLDGKTAITPLFNKEVPIKAHPLAQIDKGTGLVMMCSAGDLSDIQFFREMNLIPTIAINIDGTMNEHAGFLKGLPVRGARSQMIESLKEKGLVVKQSKIIHRTPICERSKDEIEFISMKEFYLKQIEFKEDMKKLSNKINFYSPKSKQILLDWIDSVSIDWPISRRRYYATEVPLWYCKKCNETFVPEKGKYYKPWKENPSVKKCKCGSTEFQGDERVFDTWFDSSISPLYILKYSRNEEFFKNNSPCSLRPQGKEIVRTWLYYTLLKDYLLTNKPIFKDVWIHYHIVDENGKKMSKSIGNIIDPQKILQRYGAEAFRLWCVLEGNIDSTDLRCSYERIEGAGKTLTKLWNVARFISMFDNPENTDFTETDKWIIGEINNLIEECDNSFKEYDFHNPLIKLKNFLWEIFASHYIEMVKVRAYNEENKFTDKEQESALWTLHYCLDILLRLFSPAIPIITYKLYSYLNNKDIHNLEYPKINYKVKSAFETKDIVELNSFVWKAKRDNNKSLKDGLTSLTIPHYFEKISKEFQFMHNAKEIKFGNLNIEF